MCYHEWSRTPDHIAYVTWGGRVHHRPPTFDLGHSIAPLDGPRYGLRRALFDAAYGHVNGYPFSAVLYFVLTRSLSKTVCERVISWEESR